MGNHIAIQTRVKSEFRSSPVFSSFLLKTIALQTNAFDLNIVNKFVQKVHSFTHRLFRLSQCSVVFEEPWCDDDGYGDIDDDDDDSANVCMNTLANSV